ncbi:Sodium- and chloride-dependent GABA transporter 2 [Nymphon striatum]|nr:Sodium- and chloride-dependent GABA transporter 2 [Nymphon striatum]
MAAPAYVLNESNHPGDFDNNLMGQLIDLQNRDMTPEDYELLLLLDENVEPNVVDDEALDKLEIGIVSDVESLTHAACVICTDIFVVGAKCLCICGFEQKLMGASMERIRGVTWMDIKTNKFGIGYGTTIVVFYLNIFYVIILAWAVLYLYYSFAWTLPWASCDNEWNTDFCYSLEREEKFKAMNMTFKDHIRNITGNASLEIMPSQTKGWDAANEFWQRKILHVTKGIHDLGSVQYELAITLAISWVMCYFCIWKGVKSSGKVVYFTATFPYLMLTILLVRGVTLDGAYEGIIYYLKPDFARLADSQVWIDAGTQIFFSYAVALGCIIALGSYNDFHNNFYKDCIFLTISNSFTSVFAGFVVFSVLGFMAKQQGVDIQYVAESGPGLAFIAYPKAVAQMQFSPLWAVLFFFMIIILGIDSQFVGIEGFITAVVDLYPQYLRYGNRREYFIAFVCFISYLLGLLCITEGGIYVFELMNYYSASGVCLLWFCFFESIAVAWVYGADRFYGNIKEMIGYRPNPVLLFAWKYMTPACCTGIFLFSVIGFKRLTYNDIYVYPDWAVAIGWCMALSSMVCIPFYMIYAILTTEGTFKERIQFLIEPQLPKRTEDDITKVVTDINNVEAPSIPMTEMESAAKHSPPPSYEVVAKNSKECIVCVSKKNYYTYDCFSYRRERERKKNYDKSIIAPKVFNKTNKLLFIIFHLHQINLPIFIYYVNLLVQFFTRKKYK